MAWHKAPRHAVLGFAAALVAATGLFAAAASADTSVAPSTITSPQPAGPAAVPIYKNAYTPKTMTVPVGQIVTWTNQDDAAHTVTTLSAPMKFDSGVFGKGKSFSHTFTAPGVYNYYCAVHPDMVGTITVTGAPAARIATAAEVPPGRPAPTGHGREDRDQRMTAP
jgi:plastocyanin